MEGLGGFPPQHEIKPALSRVLPPPSPLPASAFLFSLQPSSYSLDSPASSPPSSLLLVGLRPSCRWESLNTCSLPLCTPPTFGLQNAASCLSSSEEHCSSKHSEVSQTLAHPSGALLVVVAAQVCSASWVVQVPPRKRMMPAPRVWALDECPPGLVYLLVLSRGCVGLVVEVGPGRRES